MQGLVQEFAMIKKDARQVLNKANTLSFDWAAPGILCLIHASKLAMCLSLSAQVQSLKSKYEGLRQIPL
jgi:hypothetical protein